MSKELYWLVLTAAMTGRLWVPYILDRIMVRGVMGASANPSPADKPQAAWAQRMIAAHANTVENLGVRAARSDRAGAQHPHGFDRVRLRAVLLVPADLRRGLYRRHSGGAHTRLHRRLRRPSDAGAGDFRDVSERGRRSIAALKRLRKQRDLFQAGRLGVAEHQVHV